jgi:uncharacterized phage protein gp47/JayE
MAGVTNTGFVAKTLADLQNDLREAARRVYGKQANVDPRARVGQFLDIVAERLSEAWELAEAIAGAFDPAGATGVLLDNLAALTGTTRKGAIASTCDVVFIGTNGTALTTGRQVGVTGTSTVFETTAPGTITTASAWAATTAYAQGAIRSASGSLWYATNAGTSGSTAPNGAGPFVDGTITWRSLGSGSAFAQVPCEATATGPLQGFAGSITTIITPVAGLASVNNPLDAIPGRNEETDAELRLRRQQEIAGIGSAPLDALWSEVSQVEGVSTCVVFENVTDVTVGTIGPHGVEVLVEGGADGAIGEAIIAGKAAGIATYGTTSYAGTLSNGVGVTVNFTRPTLVSVWVGITLVKDPSSYPINGDDLVKQAIVAFGDSMALGRDVVGSALVAAIFAAVPGVLDVSAPLLGFSNPPTLPASLVMSIRQRADFDTSRITVASTNGVP